MRDNDKTQLRRNKMIEDTTFGEGDVYDSSEIEASTTSSECLCSRSGCSCSTCNLAAAHDAEMQLSLVGVKAVS